MKRIASFQKKFDGHEFDDVGVVVTDDNDEDEDEDDGAELVGVVPIDYLLLGWWSWKP